MIRPPRGLRHSLAPTLLALVMASAYSARAQSVVPTPAAPGAAPPAAPAAPAASLHRPLMPREAIDRALAPLHGLLRELAVTDAERAQVADLLARGETWAAEIVEAEHRHGTDAVQTRVGWIDLLARAMRGRIEAARAEKAAGEAEHAAVAAEERRVQARAALERVAEQRIELDRGAPVATLRLPPPDPVVESAPTVPAPTPPPGSPAASPPTPPTVLPPGHGRAPRAGGGR